MVVEHFCHYLILSSELRTGRFRSSPLTNHLMGGNHDSFMLSSVKTPDVNPSVNQDRVAALRTPFDASWSVKLRRNTNFS